MNTLIKRLSQSRLAVAGIIFLAINITTSYMFYQVNSYKILLAIIGVSLLAVFYEAFFYKKAERPPWKYLLFLLLPLLATIPGYIFYQGRHNYNFRYELVSNLILILWAFYLCRMARSEKDLPIFITLLGVAVIYGCLWAILEKLGYYPQITGEGNLQISNIWLVFKKFLSNPFDWEISVVAKVKSSFGHRNYFSGFLILLLPVFLIFSMPEHENVDSLKKKNRRLAKINIFSLTVFLMGITALLAAQTRAAIAACVLSLILSLYLYYIYFSPALWRKRPLIPIITLLGFGALSALFMFLFLNEAEKVRIFQLFTFQGWVGRLLPWQTAISSIKASPFAGFGLGSSYNLFFSYVNPDVRLFHHERSYNHAHSEILEYLQESGALGLLVYIAFWAYIIFLLFKILKNSPSKYLTKLAIGICGSFLAYHVHSTFSVAPRMVVMKLALFTLFALVFISDKLLITKKPSNAAGPKEKTATMACVFIVLVGVWAIYIPWMKGQYGFVKIEQRRPSLLKVLELEEHVKDYPDIYALDRLSYYQIQYKRTKQLRRTIEKIESIIPHYRELGFKKLILAVMENDLKAAKKAGLEFQARDRYYVSGINILTRLAFRSGDYQLFDQQFRLIMKLAVFKNGLVATRNSSKVQVETKKIPKNLIIEENEDSLLVVWNENFIKWVFNQGLLFWRSKNNQYSQNTQNYLNKILLSDPYFKAKANKPLNKEELKEIEDKALTYLDAKKRFDSLASRINRSYESKVRSGKKENAELLRTGRDNDLEKLRKSYLPKLEAHKKFLESRIDWDSFILRQNFVKNFITRLNDYIFKSSK